MLDILFHPLLLVWLCTGFFITLFLKAAHSYSLTCPGCPAFPSQSYQHVEILPSPWKWCKRCLSLCLFHYISRTWGMFWGLVFSINFSWYKAKFTEQSLTICEDHSLLLRHPSSAAKGLTSLSISAESLYCLLNVHCNKSFCMFPQAATHSCASHCESQPSHLSAVFWFFQISPLWHSQRNKIN